MSKNVTAYLAFFASFFIAVFVVVFVFAENVPAVDIPSGGQGTNDKEIAEFERAFGASPAAFESSSATRPKLETPGKISDEVRQYVSDKDLTDVYCAMTRWKSGQFLSAMDAIKKYIVSPVEKARALGVDVDLPDIDAIKSEGQERIDGICAAGSLAEAEKLTEEFSDWGRNIVEDKFAGFRSSVQEKMEEKRDDIRQKVKAEIDSFIAAEKASIEDELRLEAEKLGQEKQKELIASPPATPPNIEAIKAEIMSKIEIKAAAKKTELENKIKANIDKIIGGREESLKEIGTSFESIGRKIDEEIKANGYKYAQYKKQAFELRKALVLKILDKNIEEGLARLDAAAGDLEEAKKQDASLKNAAQIKAEIQRSRKDLEVKINAALASGEESDFQQALNDFKLKWETFRQESETAASQSVANVCASALVQFGKAKEQIEPNLSQINNLRAKCVNNFLDECLKINEFAPRFNTLTSKIEDIKSEMAIAENICQMPEAADRNNLIALMKKIQSDADDLKIYREAFEAEKSKAIVGSAQQACSQVLPQLAAAEAELIKNDMAVLRNKIAKCEIKSTKECDIVNQTAAKFDKLNSDVIGFSADVAKIERFCQDPDEEKFEETRDILGTIKNRGDALKLLSAQLRSEQAEKAGEKVFCRSIVSELEMAKKEISGGLNEALIIQSECVGKADVKCARVNSLAGKFSVAKIQSENVSKKIFDINTVCDKASNDVPSDSFVSDINSFKSDKDALMKNIADLKTEKDKGYEMGQEIVIFSKSAWEGTLPVAKTLEVLGRIDYSKAAGGQFLMEIYVNGKSLSGSLLNKDKTFKFADGRSFPYHNLGGGDASDTKFKDGRPFTYYNPPSPAWMLFYAPDFTTDNTPSAGGYQVLTDAGEAHRYVWNVSSIIGAAQTMNVRVYNNGFVGEKTLPLVLKLYAE